MTYSYDEGADLNSELADHVCLCPLLRIQLGSSGSITGVAARPGRSIAAMIHEAVKVFEEIGSLLFRTIAVASERLLCRSSKVPCGSKTAVRTSGDRRCGPDGIVGPRPATIGRSTSMPESPTIDGEVFRKPRTRTCCHLSRFNISTT